MLADALRGHWFPWNCSHRQLWAILRGSEANSGTPLKQLVFLTTEPPLSNPQASDSYGWAIKHGQKRPTDWESKDLAGLRLHKWKRWLIRLFKGGGDWMNQSSVRYCTRLKDRLSSEQFVSRHQPALNLVCPARHQARSEGREKAVRCPAYVSPRL